MRLEQESILRKINETGIGRYKRAWIKQMSKIAEKRGKKRNMKELTAKNGRSV